MKKIGIIILISLLLITTFANASGEYEVLRVIDTGREIDVSPIVYGNIVITPTYNGELIAYNIYSGVVVWNRSFDKFIPRTILMDDGVLYGYLGSYLGLGDIYAVWASNGTIKWSCDINSKSISPVIYGDEIYVCSIDNKLYCVEKQRGEIIWKIRLAGTTCRGPDVSENGIYIGINDTLYQYTLNGIEMKHSAPLEPLCSPPTVFENHVYIIGDYNLWCLNGELEVVWKHLIPYLSYSKPVIYKDSVIIPLLSMDDTVETSDGGVLALHLETGETKWMFNTTNRVSAFTLYNDILYFGTDDGIFHKIFASNGTEICNVPLDGIILDKPVIDYRGNIYLTTLEGKLYVLQENTTMLYSIARANPVNRFYISAMITGAVIVFLA